MSITDELREYAEKAVKRSDYMGGLTFDLRRIADRIDAALEGYIELPKDADGQTIRIGDSIETFMGEDGTCVAIELVEGGGWNVSLRPSGWDTPTLFAAESVRHVQPDSWERIIEDAQADGVRYYNDGKSSDFFALVERCKRLAELVEPTKKNVGEEA